MTRLRRLKAKKFGQLEDNTYPGVGTPNSVNRISTGSQEKNVQEEIIELHLPQRV